MAGVRSERLRPGWFDSSGYGAGWSQLHLTARSDNSESDEAPRGAGPNGGRRRPNRHWTVLTTTRSVVSVQTDRPFLVANSRGRVRLTALSFWFEKCGGRWLAHGSGPVQRRRVEAPVAETRWAR